MKLSEMPVVTVEQIMRFRQAAMAVEQQRDELLAAIEGLRDVYSRASAARTRAQSWKIADKAIAQAGEKQ